MPYKMNAITGELNYCGLTQEMKDKAEEIEAEVGELQSNLDELEMSNPVEIKRAVNLDWLYNQNRIAFELFSSTYTLRDLLDTVGGVVTVNGDDSVDVSDTSGLTVGNEYVITDGVSVTTAVVAEIFSATRFRAAEAIDVSMTDAELSSTNFEIDGGHGLAGVDGLYFAHNVNIGNVEDGAVIVRNSGNPGDLQLFFKDDEHSAWAECAWKWKRDAAAGTVDVEYLLPARGYFSLKMVNTADADVVVSHLVCVGADTGLLGEHNGPAQPENASPEDDASDIPEQPTLVTREFDSDGFAGTSLSDGGSTDLWTESSGTAGEYYYTGSAIGGRPSAVFADGASLTEQDDPGALAAGEWAWGDNDTLGSDTVYVKLSAGDPDGQAADYVTAGEVHIASQWQIREQGGSYDSSVYDSGESSDLIGHQVPAGNLEEGETMYYFRVRHKGENIGWSSWSAETKFTTKDVFARIFGIALVSTGGGAGTWQQIDQDGNNINPTTTDFNNHPVWGDMGDVTVDDQAMVKIPKFYVKTGVAPAGSDQAGKKGWWVSDVDAPGFVVHPAFMDAGVEIDQFYVGKYECCDDPDASGTKAASLVDEAPLVSIDFPTMQDRCEARNTGGVDGFQLWGIYHAAAIQLLALIELGTPDVQSAIAAGRVDESSAGNTGSTDAVYRGIYELWGNTRTMLDGLQLDGSHQVKIWDLDGNQNYQSTGVNTTSSNGWVVTLHDESGTDWDLSLIFLGKTTTSTEGNGTLADYLYASDASQDNVCYHGGRWVDGSQAGLFCLNCSAVASRSHALIGGRLAKL